MFEAQLAKIEQAQFIERLNNKLSHEGIFVALISCDECGAEISDKANSCPKCGFPLKQDTDEQAISNIIRLKTNEIIALIFVCVVLTLMWNSAQTAKEVLDEADDDYKQCKEDNPSVTISPRCYDEMDDWNDAWDDYLNADSTFTGTMIMFGIILSIYFIRKYLKSPLAYSEEIINEEQ